MKRSLNKIAGFGGGYRRISLKEPSPAIDPEKIVSPQKRHCTSTVAGICDERITPKKKEWPPVAEHA